MPPRKPRDGSVAASARSKQSETPAGRSVSPQKHVQRREGTEIGAESTAKGRAGGWKDTSVNVANAFQQARNRPARALSPAEQLQSAARALSPVRFFLRPGARDDDQSTSFSSLGDNTNASYCYEAEEAFVKAAAQVRKKPRVPRDELAYRPEDSGEESEEVGEGIHLDARENRGKRGERGEGYLGMGIAFQRGTSRRKNGGGPTIDYGVENDSDDDGVGVGEGSYQHRGYTPQINVQEIEPKRSPTPMRLLRALSPRKSPYPSQTPLPGPSARRRPSRVRSLVTSTLNTILTALLSAYNAIAKALNEGKWLRWLATGFAILIALRLLEPLLGTMLGANEPPSALPTSFDEFAGRLTTLETSFTKLDGRVGHSESEIKSLKRDLGSQIEAIERELVGVRTRLGDVEEGVKGAIDDGRLRAALESFLPSRMPVRYVRGGLEIDPAFWVDLKKTFAGHDDVDRAVRDAVSRAGAGKGTMPDLAAFEERLAVRFGREQRDTANKAWFIDTLERELVTLRTSFDEKLRLAKALNATPRSNAKSKSVSNDDLVPFLQDLIDAALLRYSKDTIARADHALHSAGARVIPSITSDTFTVRQPSAFGRWVLGRKPVEGHPPAMALHPERSVGSCWPFEGSAGQLGVLLANRAVVQAVSIEHAPGELVASVASAPKGIEIWGLVEGEDNREKARLYREAMPPNETSLPPSEDYLLLASISYDPAAPNPIQTYPLETALIELDIDVGIVVFKVLDNWGADYTCLYRVRVHGQVSEQ